MRHDLRFPLHRVEVGRHRIAYRHEEVGDPGPPLVLVHGLGMSSRSFSRLLPLIAEEFDVWAPDLPGCGASTHDGAPLDVDTLVDALADWMRAVGLRDVTALGHSLGGQVVCLLAARHPELVGRAVLVAPTPDPAHPRRGALAARLVLDGLREPVWLVGRAGVDYLRARPRRMWRQLRNALSQDLLPHADALQVPAVVIRGEHDPVVGADWARRLGGRLSHGDLQIPGGSHGLPAQSPRELARLLREFTA